MLTNLYFSGGFVYIWKEFVLCIRLFLPRGAAAIQLGKKVWKLPNFTSCLQKLQWLSVFSNLLFFRLSFAMLLIDPLLLS